MTPIERVQNFVNAGVSLGQIHLDRAIAEGVDQTGHSCFAEGHAAGFKEAMRIVANYVQSAIEDEEAKR
jgi:hypothetical protein